MCEQGGDWDDDFEDTTLEWWGDALVEVVQTEQTCLLCGAQRLVEDSGAGVLTVVPLGE